MLLGNVKVAAKAARDALHFNQDITMQTDGLALC